MTVVELCAGSAAVSMRLLGQRRLCGYMGGKGRFATRIIREMGLPMPSRVVLCDSGPWGRVWRDLPGIELAVALRIESMRARARDDVELFTQLGALPPPADTVCWLATFLVLQALSWRTKPITISMGAWRHSGVSHTRAQGVAGTSRFGAVRPGLDVLLELLPTLDLSRIEGHHVDARTVEPIPGAYVYMDPPYHQTQGYCDADLTRPEVLSIAARWAAAGCCVAVSEAEPIGAGMAVKVGSKGKTAGLASGARDEWLTTYNHRQPALFSRDSQ